MMVAYAPVFADPHHDHAPCAEKTLARAERLCAQSGARLTAQRRQVLLALAATHEPVGAYELIERLAEANGHKPAPNTIYRALDFLIEQRLAHRIESKNAFVACAQDHGADGVVMFLICETCGAVGESQSSAVGASIAIASRNAGFKPRGQVIEIAGKCGHCASS